jgi:hypothetical protein
MDRGAVLLQGLRNQLQGWLMTIQRATCATNVSFVPLADGEFMVRVEWQPKGGEKKTFDRTFSKPEILGTNPAQWRVQRRACDYARDIMRDVLAARGAIT